MRGRFLSTLFRSTLPLILTALFAATLPAAAKEKTATKYLVLQVTNHEGKVSYKPLADDKQEQFRKDLDEEFLKAKKAHAEAKKAFEKDNKGQKYEKTEPAKPKIKVMKKDLKTFPDARQVALDLEKGNGKKNGKNGKNGDSAKTGTSKH